MQSVEKIREMGVAWQRVSDELVGNVEKQKEARDRSEAGKRPLALWRNKGTGERWAPSSPSCCLLP